METINTLFGSQTLKAERTEETIYLDPSNLIEDSTGATWESQAMNGQGVRLLNPKKLEFAGHYKGKLENRAFRITREDYPGLF